MSGADLSGGVFTLGPHCALCCPGSVFTGRAAEESARLRDQFAAAALTGLLSEFSTSAKHYPDTAVLAYAMADAMLAERAKDGAR